MGKKDAQRTKGNTKSASSARSAQVLGEKTGFVGFGTTAESGFVPLLQTEDGLPADFRLVMRKMHKKDVTTKLKALQEFLDLSSTAKEQDMLCLLPFWPSVYCKIATDTDRRVREQAHNALKAVVKAVGKNLAPHLKMMSGVWYIAQSDLHEPAAEAATEAWRSAFPPEKMSEAADFCQSEILNLIIENLTTATPQTLCDPKNTSTEEMEAKYDRTVSMSLLSYANLLDTVSKINGSKHKPLLASPKFWKFSKHKNVTVRKSFFVAATQLCIKLQDSVDAHANQIVPAVLGNLYDLEAGEAVWTCALQLLSVYEDSWKYINFEKTVLPAVLKLLRSAADGRPRILFPCMMPFLSKVPFALSEDPSRLCRKWFSSIIEGFNFMQEKSKNRMIEEVMMQVLVDCAFFVCNLKALDTTIKTDVIRDYLLPGLLNYRCHGNCSRLSEYLLYWNRQCSKDSEVGHLNNVFWSGLKFHVTEEPAIHVDLLIDLGNSLNASPRKEAEDKQNIEFFDEFNSMNKKIFTDQIENLKNEENVESALKIIDMIVSNFGSKKNACCRCSDIDFKECYTETILPMFSNKCLEDLLIKVTVSIALTLSQTECMEMLDTFVRNNSPNLTSKLIEIAKHSDKELFRSLMASQSIEDFVAQVSSSLLENLLEQKKGNDENWTAIKTAMGSGVNFPLSLQRDILCKFDRGLNHEKELVDTLEEQRFIESVCEVLCLMTKQRGDIILEEEGLYLMKSVFSIQTLDTNQRSNMKLEQCWTSIVEIVPELSLTFAREIGDKIHKSVSSADFNSLLHKSEILVRIVSEKDPDLLVQILDLMYNKVERNFAEQAWYRSVFEMKHFLPCVSETFEDSLRNQDVLGSTNLMHSKNALLLLTSLGEGFGINGREEVESKTVLDEERVNLPDNLVDNRNLMEGLIESLLSVVYMENLLECKNDSMEILELGKKLKATATRFFSKLSKKSLNILESRLFEKCKTQEVHYNLALEWIFGVTYCYSEWDLRLNRYLNIEDIEIEELYNTIASSMELTSRYNIGSGTISSSLSIAVGKFVSLEGLNSESGTCLLWFITRCLILARTGNRLHVSGLSEFSGEIESTMKAVETWMIENVDQLLYNTDISVTRWESILRVCTVCNFLNLLVSKHSELINSKVWDQITCSLVSWVGSLEESQDSLLSRSGCLLFSISVSKLIASVSELLGPKGHHPALSPAASLSRMEPPVKLLEEWGEFFSEGIFTVIVPLYLKLCAGNSELCSSNLISKRMGQCLVHCTLPVLLSCELPPLHLVQDMDAVSMPDVLTFIFNHFGPLLSSCCRSSQITSAHILAAATQELTKNVSAEEGEEREIPRRLLDHLNQGEVLLNNILEEFSVVDPVGEIPTGTIAFSQTFGFFLAWRVILKLLEYSSDEIRPQYSQYLQSGGHIDSLLNNVFKILPTSSAQLEVVFGPLFLEVDGEPFSMELQHLAASCWIQVCHHLPAYARQWWTKLHRESQTTVEKITCVYVTPALWTQEVEMINASKKLDNLTLKVRDSVREVVATYSIDEGSMELVVSLPNNYPLGGLSVDSGKRVGVETGQWRKWMLALTTFLIHQNGSILEGLTLWKRNVDKRFEGVEECYICFYILHGSNHQLPKLACRTCKKKFHSACLYKWFSTSNNSSCPLCRNLF